MHLFPGGHHVQIITKCKDTNQTEVQWAFRGIETPMGVATYDNVRIKEIEEQLPSVEAIQARLEQAEEEFRLNIKQGK